MAGNLNLAKAELRRRQGAGARYDAPSAPALELGWVRLGTGYFARILNGMDDAQFDEPSRFANVSRRQVVTRIGLEARLLGEMIGSLRNGKLGLPIPSLTPSSDRTCADATLPIYALRNLFIHSAIHLNVEWRDLNDSEWNDVVQCEDGKRIEIRSTPQRRAISIWSAAIDLRLGGRMSDIPRSLIPLLYSDS